MGDVEALERLVRVETTVDDLKISFRDHEEFDHQRFGMLNKEVDEVTKAVQALQVKLAYYSGAIVVLTTAASWALEYIK